MRIAALKEPQAEKMAFFRAVQAAAGGDGVALPTWPIRATGYPETAARAEIALDRAKKQPKGAVGRAAKRAFLAGRYNWARHYFTRHPDQAALCWQGLTGTRWAVMQGARDAGAQTFYAELSPLPGMLTLDPRGVNAAGSVPQDPAFYDDVTADVAVLSQITSQFKARAPRRTDVGQGAGDLAGAGNYLFVPLQVPDDSQMILFSGWCGGMAGFIRALGQAAEALPPGWHLRIKEHPSARVSLADEIAAAGADGAPVVLDNDTDSLAQMRGSRGVLTVNSSMGLQAMFTDTPVIATGETFWALPGLAHHAGDLGQLAALLAEAADLTFDADLRARFLTWLAQVYYIPREGGADRIRARLAGDLA